MKNIFKSFMIALAAVSMFAACSEKEEGPVDPYSVNWTYLRPKNVPMQKAIMTDSKEVVLSFAESVDTVLTYIQSTKPAKSTVTATFGFDESLIEAYNTKNGTKCQMMQHVSLVSNTLTIEPGQYVSRDTLKIKYDEAAIEEFIKSHETEAEYLLPITMTSVSEGATMSETRTIYLYYKLYIKTAEQSNSPLGTKFAGSMTVYVNGVDCTSTLTDGSTYSDMSFSGSKEIVIDLQETANVSDVRLRPYVDTYYYMVGNVAVAFSTDGSNYEGAGEYAIQYGNGLTQFYISFYSSKTAQYIKLNTSGALYYSPWLAEVEVYTK